MFQYYVKQTQHCGPSKSKPMLSNWTKRCTHVSGHCVNRPLPPRPITCQASPEHATVPLRIWIIASGFCFTTCAALVLATIIITRWDNQNPFAGKEMVDTAARISSEDSDKKLSSYTTSVPTSKTTTLRSTSETMSSPYKTLLKEIESVKPNPITELNIVEPLRNPENLISKSQIHPIHEEIPHIQRNTRKKDKAIHKEIPNDYRNYETTGKWHVKNYRIEDNLGILIDPNNGMLDVPKFKPIAPFLSVSSELDATEASKEKTEEAMHLKYSLNDEDLVLGLKNSKTISNNVNDNSKSSKFMPYGFDGKEDYFYNDDNFYDDYMQSNTMTSYLIEKVQEVHDWVTTDPDLNNNYTTSGKDFASLLKALNESIIDGNLTIVMTKLRDMYFGDNYTNINNSRKPVITNNTDLLSFGILTLDSILLHNIQTMAWENQESAKIRMMRDPNVYAFNALFTDPSKLEHMQNNLDGSLLLRRLGPRPELFDYGDVTQSFFENILEAGMSTARAAIHLGKAYKNTKNALQNTQQQNKTVPPLISRNINSNSHALNHLQNTFDNKNVQNSSFSSNGSFYTELDCIWLLYCKNLEATSKLNMPYGTMARINGIALRILTGDLVPDRALDTITYEVLTGGTDLNCDEMFPRCSKANAASIVLESIMQGHRKSSTKMKSR